MKLLFPSIVHEIPVPNFESIQSDLIKFVYKERKKDPKGERFSNKGGWQSTPKYNREKNILMDTCSNVIQSYLKDILQPGTSLGIHGAWININSKGNYNEFHTHPHCHLAAVFWIKLPKDSGNIDFQNPQHFLSAGEMDAYLDDFKNSTNCWQNYHIVPTEGTIVLFPAHLTHGVNPNKSRQDRISFAFNIFLSSNLGGVKY
tara:strand:+ start:56 stop:661 length:606 start_codon:yes stop_codon:yes gene_type:complete